MNGTNVIDKEEFIFAWKSIPDLKKLAQKSQTLGPLVKRHGFAKDFLSIYTENKVSITFDEFIKFCQEGFANKK